MKTPFELDWMGGAAEHYFRKTRPGTAQLPWGTLDPSRYEPVAVAYARSAWTDSVINEYRAIISFSEMARALLDVRAPLDLIGMASDFLGDECAHAEMASRLAMELGGALERNIDVECFTPRPRGLTAMQGASELVLRISCIEEAFSVGVMTASMQATTHPLPRAVYEAILRDESHHSRLGGLYFEWALSRIDEAELTRLGRVLLSALQDIRFLWNPDPRLATVKAPWGEINALGWLEPMRFAEVARGVVAKEILDPLATIGIGIEEGERATLLGTGAVVSDG